MKILESPAKGTDAAAAARKLSGLGLHNVPSEKWLGDTYDGYETGADSCGEWGIKDRPCQIRWN